MDSLNRILRSINSVIWHDAVLFGVLGLGIVFTLWSVGCQVRSLTHGVGLLTGRHDRGGPGAISHFQALSAALSATVGLGNIGGVALAIALGGPGAVFWMWIIGAFGMALKTAEVTLSMLYRDTTDPEHPRGGPMYVADRAFASIGRPRLGKAIARVFVVTLLVSTVTGGNMFQAWNVADVSHAYFGIPKVAVGLVLAVVVALVIVGGIQRIGAVAGRLVPTMCTLYLCAALWVLVQNFEGIPGMLSLIVTDAFRATDPEGAFLGGTAGYALLWGMKRALFSSEVGQGSSPIAHAAARTEEPAREGIVAGLEPFLDTLVVCTLTALVILLSGVWNRGPDLTFESTPALVETAEGTWSLAPTPLRNAESTEAQEGAAVFAVLHAGENASTGLNRHRLAGALAAAPDGAWVVNWASLEADAEPELAFDGAFFDYKGATLTAKSFDRTAPGLGKWLVPLAAWLFAISTMISWSYYGTQGVLYLFGERWVLPYKLAYCGLAVVATIPALISTDTELDNLTSLGTGVMLWANLPIVVIFGNRAMRAYHTYVRRLRAGEFGRQQTYGVSHSSSPSSTRGSLPRHREGEEE